MFDLALLFARPDAAEISLSEELRALVPRATENAIAISYDEHISKVVAYLEAAHAAIYDSRDAWNVLQDSVVARLEELA